jgi:hypothetical protein
MDSKELEIKLQGFLNACKASGKSIDKMCLMPAYPGVADSSYNVKVKGEWLNHTICSEALEILIDILFEQTDVETRTNIFCIRIINDNEDVSCESFEVKNQMQAH